MPKRKPRKSIGIIVPSIIIQFRDNSLDLLTKTFADRGYRTTVSLSGGDLEREREYFMSVAVHSDCLVVVSCAEKYSEIEDVIPSNIPVLFLFHQPKGCPHTCIMENDYSAIYQGIISMSNRDAKNIVFVTHNYDKTFSKNCFKAYIDAMNVVNPDSNCNDFVYIIDDLDKFNLRKWIDEILNNKCEAIFCTSPSLTAHIIDAMMFYAKDFKTNPLPILGYTFFDSPTFSQMFIDTIISPYDEIISLTVQQALYLIEHPNAPKRESLLKGTFRAHQYDLN